MEMLFQLLPVSDQKSLRDCYKTILHSQPGHSWDIERSIDDLLAHLGRDPITESRYFWDINTVKRKGVSLCTTNFRAAHRFTIYCVALYQLDTARK